MTTWPSDDASFEFACFTDDEIAAAVDALDDRQNKPALGELTHRVASVRASRGNLKKSVLRGVAGKGRLAEELWPCLKRKIELALEAGTAHQNPAVHVMLQADGLAREYAGGRWVLSRVPLE